MRQASLLRRHAPDRTAAGGISAHRVRSGAEKTIRCFPDKLPIGIEKDDTSRFVFLYLVNRRIPVDFRQFLIRHRDLFRNLHHWTVRLLVPRRFRKAAGALQGGRPGGALDATESERKQVPGDVLSRTAGAGRTPRRAVRSLHRPGVPKAGHAEDPGPLSGVATSRRQGALAVVLDVLARRLVVRPFGR